MDGIVDCLIMYCLFQYASIHIRMAQAISDILCIDITVVCLLSKMFCVCVYCDMYIHSVSVHLLKLFTEPLLTASYGFVLQFKQH